MKRLLIIALLMCPPTCGCQYPDKDGTAEPSVQDCGTQFAPETASMTETTPSGSYDNGGISESSNGDTGSSSGGCWSSYDN